MINHPFTGARLHSRPERAAMASFGRRANRWEVAEEPVCIAEEKTVAHRGPVAKVHLKFDERLTRKRGDGELAVYQHGCNWHLQRRPDQWHVVTEEFRRIHVPHDFLKFARSPPPPEWKRVLGKLDRRLTIFGGIDPLRYMRCFLAQPLAFPLSLKYGIFLGPHARVIRVDIAGRTL